MLEEFLLKPIGRVESPVKEPVDENWGTVTSRIILTPNTVPDFSASALSRT